MVWAASTLLKLREATDPMLGINLDPSHMMILGADPIAAARALKGCIFHVHGKDARIERGLADVDGILEPRPVTASADRVWNYVAVGCGKDVPGGELADCIRRGAKGRLKDVALFDIYTGVGIAPGKKSVAFNLPLRSDDRSLTAEEADADVKSILTALEQECGAVLR